MVKVKENWFSSKENVKKLEESWVKNKRVSLGKIVRVIPFAFILVGIILAGFSLTGNVVGSLRTGLSSFGAGFFVVGIIGLFISLKRD